MPPSTTSIPIQQKHCIWPWCNVPLDPAYAVAGVCERCMTRRIALGASEAASARYGPVPPQRNLSTTAPPYTPFHTFPQRNDPIPSSSTLQPVDLVGERIRARFPQSYPPREVIPSTSQLVDLVGERERKRMEAGLYSIDDAANMLHIKYLDPQYQLANLPSSVHSHITQQKQARRETQNPYPRVGVMIPSSTPLVPIPIPVLAQSLSGPPVPQRTQTPRLPQLQIPQTPRIPPLPQISPSPQPQSRPESQSPMVQPYPSPSQSPREQLSFQSPRTVLSYPSPSTQQIQLCARYGCGAIVMRGTQGGLCWRCVALVREHELWVQEKEREKQQWEREQAERGRRKVGVKERGKGKGKEVDVKKSELDSSVASSSTLPFKRPAVPISVPRNVPRKRKPSTPILSDAHYTVPVSPQMTLTTHTAPVPASQKAEHDSAVPVQRFYRPTLSSKDMHALGPVDGLDASGTLELDRYSQREEEEEEEEPHRPLEPELVQGGQEKDGVPHCSEHVEKSAELRHDVLQSSESVVPLCSEPVGNEELQQPELHSALVQQNNQLVHERNQYGVVQDEQAPGVQYQVQRSVEQQGIKEVQQQQVVHGNSQVEKEVKREQIAPLLSFSTLGAGSDDEMELEFVYPDIQEIEDPPPRQPENTHQQTGSTSRCSEVKVEPVQDLMSVVLGQRQREAGSAGADVSVPPVPVQYQMLPPALYIPSISQQGSRSRTQEGRVPYRPVHRRLLPPSSSSAGLYTTAPLPPSQLRKVTSNGENIPMASPMGFMHQKIRRASSGQAVNGGASSSTTKTCASPDCSTIIPPASTSSRCMLCVRKAWMSRKSRGTVAKSAMASTEKRGTKEVRTLRGVLVEIGRPKMGRKSVTWADLPGSVSDEGADSEEEPESENSLDSGEEEDDEEVPREKLKLFIPKAAVLALKAKREAAAKHNGLSENVDLIQVNKVEPQDIHISMLSPSEITICEEAENQVASPKAAESLLDSPAVMNRNERDDIYPSVDEGNMVVEEKNVTSVKVLAAEMNNSDQVEVGPAAPSTAVTCGSGYVEPVEMTTSSSLKTPITVDTHGPMDIGQSSSAEEDTIAGWDSDLTCISESNDEGESELDSSPLEVDESSLERLRQHTGLTIKIPARSSINISVCTITNCNQVLPSGYPWKSCARCRARTRECQRKRQNLQGRHTKLDNELELLHTGVSINDLYSSFEPPTDLSGTETECAVVPGARLCSLKSCSHIIPPTSEYKWKMCSHCRKKTSKRRRRKELKSRIENGLPVDAMNVSDSDMECLNPKLLPGRCVNQDCGMLVDDTASSSECRQCIARRLGLPGSNGMKRGHPRGARTSNLGATIASAQTARSPSEKGLNPLRSIKPPPSPPYPPYKCLTALLSDFSARLDDFLEAQLLYFYYIQQNTKRSMGTIFGFDGEFSTVAMDYDVIGRRDEVEKGILNMKREIERCGTFSFSPDRRVSIINTGIITHFMCVHQSSTHIPTPAIPGQAHIPTFTKTLKGEVEIAVLEDRSHSFLPGQRTVIRFRMIG